jgi:hypothetical protein
MKLIRPTATTTTNATTAAGRPKTVLRDERGGATLVSAQGWGGHAWLASGGLWTIVPAVPRIERRELHFVHLMRFPTWISSAWYV